MKRLLLFALVSVGLLAAGTTVSGRGFGGFRGGFGGGFDRFGGYSGGWDRGSEGGWGHGFSSFSGAASCPTAFTS